MSISIAAEVQQKRFWGFDGRGCLVPASFFGSYLINGVGKAILPAIKKQVTLRLDADVLAWLRKQRRGYQTRANSLVREIMVKER